MKEALNKLEEDRPEHPQSKKSVVPGTQEDVQPGRRKPATLSLVFLVVGGRLSCEMPPSASKTLMIDNPVVSWSSSSGLVGATLPPSPTHLNFLS
ncbi:hypothetical protein Pcinc_009113 [Petrolisthes cinctipes]|uniref:Uncharacterized protein n=1 Tax=Petrolisthes cinctipes TaxID=88211 RepID=A0AAE1G7L9_PETCI|nr:hypothetical protein Pcinc_009113 [Petrolisthes cinctipes]